MEKFFVGPFYSQNLNCFCFLMEDTYHCEKSIKKNSDGLARIYVVDVYDEFIGSRCVVRVAEQTTEANSQLPKKRLSRSKQPNQYGRYSNGNSSRSPFQRRQIG